MLAKKISSLQHPLVKHWVELRKSRSLREEVGRVLLVGEKVIREFPFAIKNIVSTEPVDLRAEEAWIAPEEILRKIAGIDIPAAMVAEVELPPPQDLSGKRSLLILDGLQDPGNAGTLLRTAFALGWEGVVATPGTVDFFNDKAIRAGQGAIFRFPYCWQEPEQIEAWARDKKATLWVADARGKPLKGALPGSPMALVLGSEGNGPGKWTKSLGVSVSIPMVGEVESLNVAAAGAILLYALRDA